MNKKSKTIALFGVWAAVIFIMLLLETYVFSTVLPVAPPAVFSLAATFSVCVFKDWKFGIAGGVIFGVCSMIVASMIGNAYFILPWVSLLPRAVAGGIAWAVCAGATKLFQSAKSEFWRETLPSALGGMFGVLCNSLLVLTMLAISTDAYGGSFLKAMQALIVTNTLFELLAGLILVPVIVKTVKKAYYKGNTK